MANLRVVSLLLVLKSVLVLIVFVSKIFERLHVLNLIENLSEVLHHVGAKDFDVLQLDELEELEDGGFEEIVAAVVADESFDDRREEISLDDVPTDGNFKIKKEFRRALAGRQLTDCKSHPSSR